MSSYAESAERGDLIQTVRYGVITGTLWAIGISWSTAIRGVTILVLPEDVRDQIFAELLATLITTVFGVGVAVLTSCRCAPRRESRVQNVVEKKREATKAKASRWSTRSAPGTTRSRK